MTAADGNDDWRIFRGNGTPRDVHIPAPPPWRDFTATPPHIPAEWMTELLPRPYLIGRDQADVVSAAIALRRPLLVTGNPGTGKSSLATAIAHELRLGRVLHWPVNSRSLLQDALYRYDAVGRLRESGTPGIQDGPDQGIGSFIRLGPLGTALVPAGRPRVLLIDELDKGDLDLPNDLLHVFEEGEFEIQELSRLADHQSEVRVFSDDPGETVDVHRGRVQCTEFPVVVMTSNGERDFPPAFLRRCVRLQLPDPDAARLQEIVRAHLGPESADAAEDLVQQFVMRRELEGLATDQLLNAVFLRLGGVTLDAEGLLDAVLHRLNAAD